MYFLLYREMWLVSSIVLLRNVDVSRTMIISVRSARARYLNNLSMKREKQEQDKKTQKRKAEEDKLSELQHDCKWLKTDIAQLTENAKKIRVNQHAMFPL